MVLWGHGVASWRTFTYNFQKFAMKLTPDEIKGVIVTILISAFVYSFDQWGGDEFSLVSGILNLLVALVFVAIALFVQQLAQRIWAVYYGYDPEYQFNMIGLMIGLVIAFASRGALILFMPGYTMIHHLAASRLGEFRYYPSYWEWAKVSFAGIAANFYFALILSLLPFKEIELLNRLVMINLWFAIFSLIPFPNNPGFYIFFTHKNFWAFCVGFVVGGTLLLLFTSFLIALIGSFVLGVVAIFWFFFTKDKQQAGPSPPSWMK